MWSVVFLHYVAGVGAEEERTSGPVSLSGEIDMSQWVPGEKEKVPSSCSSC